MAGKAKRVTGVRWDPLFIRWCLNLSRVSPKAYEIMRVGHQSTHYRQTLNDYTHWMSTKAGFSSEIYEFLQTEAKVEELEDWQKYVCSYICMLLYIPFCVGFYTWLTWLTCLSFNFTIPCLFIRIFTGLLF